MSDKKAKGQVILVNWWHHKPDGSSCKSTAPPVNGVCKSCGAKRNA